MALKPLDASMLCSICSSVPDPPYDVQSAPKDESVDSLWAFLWCFSPSWQTALQMGPSPAVGRWFLHAGALRPQVETSTDWLLV